MDETEKNRTAEVAERPAKRTDYWEQLYDMFPGATVLDDLALHPDDAVAARWIIVRYAAVRAAASLLNDELDARETRIERNVGLNHLRSVPMLDREAWSLRKMLDALKTTTPTRDVVIPLIDAGTAAAERGHSRGAYAMYHVAYRLCTRKGWHSDGARAARGIETLARADGAVYSPRLWRRRARVLEKRAAVA